MAISGRIFHANFQTTCNPAVKVAYLLLHGDIVKYPLLAYSQQFEYLPSLLLKIFEYAITENTKIFILPLVDLTEKCASE